MVDLDHLAPNYRRAQQRWPGAPTLGRCYEALAACVDGDAHGLVEHVKSFVESVCLTIMGELREPMPSSTPSTTDLLVAALGPLGLRNSKGASKLDKVLSGFNRLADALSEMRNELGPVAHGKDGFLDPVAADHCRAFLHAGDAILGVLLNAFEGKQPDLIVTREPYESFPHLNDRIDRAVRVEAWVDEEGERPILVCSVGTGALDEAIQLRVEPSRLLYGIDRQAYLEMLRSAEQIEAKGVEESEDAEVPLGIPKPAQGLPTAPQGGPVIVIVPEYSGALDPLRPGIENFLLAEGVSVPAIAGGADQLVDSLLATAEENIALDWTYRPPIKAQVKVACKRVLVHLGIPPSIAETVAGHLVAWLSVQAGHLGASGSAAPVAAEGDAH